MLIFASYCQLSLLFSSPIIYMDGTFSKSPQQFKQIYIIHAVCFDICKEYCTYSITNEFISGLPCVFCLLVNKKAITYRGHIFGELKQMAAERGETFSPFMIMTDFESSVLPVIKSEVCSKYHEE